MDNETAFRLLVTAAMADWKVQEEEKQVLAELADHLGLAPEQATRIVERTGMQNVSLPDLEPAQRAFLMDACCQIVSADRVLAPGEQAFLGYMGRTLGYSDREVVRRLSASQKRR